VTNALKAIVLGVVVYIVVQNLISTMITGTTIGDTLLTDLVPLAVAVGIVWAALSSFLK
jgi:hypothetical protein